MRYVITAFFFLICDLVHAQPLEERIASLGLVEAKRSRDYTYNEILDYLYVSKDGDRLEIWRSGTGRRHVRSFPPIYEMSDGRFIGTDEGEWGGELFWEPLGGDRQRILPSGSRYQHPIYSLIPIGGDLYVMAGSQHMQSSGSMLVMYDIAENKREIQHRTLLPDAPIETLKLVDQEWDGYLELVVIGYRTISKVFPTFEIKAFAPWKGLGVTSAALVDSNTILVGLTGGLAVVDISDRNRYVTKVYVPQRYAL